MFSLFFGHSGRAGKGYAYKTDKIRGGGAAMLTYTDKGVGGGLANADINACIKNMYLMFLTVTE